MPHITFPPDFVWGAATAAFQIEGHTTADGRGESIWDRFCKLPGKIEDGSHADMVCDHYTRWQEDVGLMRELGLHAYRLSIAWPRVMPHGWGYVNYKGLDFYRRLLDELLVSNITPYVTLYHWDLPQTLEDLGGWPVRTTTEAFLEYVDIVTDSLGDQVQHWITINEPWCASFLDYQIGAHAPGRQEWPAAIAASHHLLLAHGQAIPIIKRNSADAKVGIALNFTAAVPASPSAADRDAARWFDGYFNRWFLDPLYGRHYPADMVADYQKAGYLPPEGMTVIQPGDMQAIATPTDFLAVNYYTREVLRSTAIPEEQNLPRTVHIAPAHQRTTMGWEVVPEGLYELLLRLRFDYQVNQIFISENGAAYPDEITPYGRIEDDQRIAYLQQHLHAVHRAIEAGVPMTGYFVWSLMDNFEWNRGYTQRFGLIYVDYLSQRRLFKDSGVWYQQLIQANGFQLP
jgi:beta-glucosidase